MISALGIGAFFAGVLMFLAPCTLPIVPGYLAFIGGAERRVVQNALMFVLGFSAFFVLLGASAGLFGIVIGPWRWWLARAGGILFVFFGLSMLGLLRLPVLSAERHAHLPSFLRVGHPSSSFLMGAIFAMGWSPCIGPILGSILFAASATATAGQGALLLLIFSLGMGIPFVLCAILLERAQVLVGRMSGAAVVLAKLGGAFLVVLGILILIDQAGLLVSWGYGALHFIGYDQLLKYL